MQKILLSCMYGSYFQAGSICLCLLYVCKTSIRRFVVLIVSLLEICVCLFWKLMRSSRSIYLIYAVLVCGGTDWFLEGF